MRRALLTGLFLLGFTPARAAVTDVQPAGFSVVETAEISAPPAVVWKTLIVPSLWWSSEHTYSHDAKNLKLEAVAGGRWTETLPGGGGVVHQTVVYFNPPATLRLEGALGPMQAFGMTGHLTIQLAPDAAGTHVTFTYDAGGHMPGGFTGIAPVVDQVLGEQASRLKAAVEGGK